MRPIIVMYGSILGTAVLVVAVLGFRGQMSTNRPWHVFWDMKYQPRYTAQAESRFFADGRTARMPVAGTLAYSGADYTTDAGNLHGPKADMLRADPLYYEGKVSRKTKKVKVKVPETVNGKVVEVEKEEDQVDWASNIPAKAIELAGGWEPLLARGAERYKINCLPCHGGVGNGLGITSVYGIQNIASYHQDRLRAMGDGEIFNTITWGKGTMSAYGDQVAVQDRWAIVAYVRILQASQYTDSKTITDPAERQQLGLPSLPSAGK